MTAKVTVEAGSHAVEVRVNGESETVSPPYAKSFWIGQGDVLGVKEVEPAAAVDQVTMGEAVNADQAPTPATPATPVPTPASEPDPLA